jgi:hypothetical protein
MGCVNSKKKDEMSEHVCAICLNGFVHEGVRYLALISNPRGSAPVGPMMNRYPRNRCMPVKDLVEMIGSATPGGVIMTPCKHVFHVDCLCGWVMTMKRNDCPNCRGKLYASLYFTDLDMTKQDYTVTWQLAMLAGLVFSCTVFAAGVIGWALYSLFCLF